MASLPLFNAESTPVGAPAPKLTLVPMERPSAAAAATAEARLSSLEWSIVALAERDSLSSLREPGRLAKAMELLFGLSRPNKLANSRSETLHRAAVWAWRRGWKVPQSELDAFVEAGFTLDHFELIQRSIARSRDQAKSRRQGR